VSEAAEFLLPRRCFLASIPHLNDAADLLSAAADALLARHDGFARDLLQQANMPIVHAYASRVMGKADIDIHRYRRIEDNAAAEPGSTKVARRMPASSVQADICRRDGYRCRFCGCRVVLKEARDAMRRLLPDALPWGAADKDKHAAFYALTATIDHLVPHARGGDNSPENLLTTCQPCNFGKGNWLIGEIGLLDRRSSPPVVDAWDGLLRISLHTANDPGRALAEIRRPAAVSDVPSGSVEKTKRDAKTLARQAWFAQFDQIQHDLSSRLLDFIDQCQDLRVSWSLEQVLLVKMQCNGDVLAVFGIERTGDIEIPWWIAGHKARFRSFAETLAAGIPDAQAYETKKMWRVNKAGRRLHVTELLEHTASVRIALEKLRADLDR
jgi:HNH endonuclease